MSPPGIGGKSEFYLEFIVQGGFTKVTAIDSASGTEASVMGPAGASRDALADAAVRKLNYVLKKQRNES